MEKVIKWTSAKASPILGARFKLIGRCSEAMCIFCIGDDTPFHLAKRSAFPRKMVAEAVEAGSQSAQSEPDPSSKLSCDGPEPALSPSAWPKRKAKQPNG
jgi:hypothetical protein